ncbi:DNA internalization-related competence protein ComEC/Rec2 [Deinococcus yavapaiensis]|uniref:DNA internalization-related competence protein ComEC/Rec2 n=1 Tax=Deinococcus yavapaiensis TaxID=309889 RepID=UPI001474759A|nr:DNA internalization-related competence protein ComEC/Rec2 [Deinococcus yavapaiensis]
MPVFARSISLPWSLVAFAGFAAGILVVSGEAWGAAWLLLPLLGGRSRRPATLTLVALVAALLGGSRERAEQRAPDPLASWRGALVTLSGTWDGRFLRLEDPRASVALSPKPSAPPGELRVCGRLDLPSTPRNPGEFDYSAWLRASGVRSVLYGAKVLSARPRRDARTWFRGGVRLGLSPLEADFMEAVELGDKDELNTRTLGARAANNAFAHAGLSHLMALSGQNVALIVTALSFLLAKTPLKLARYPVLLLALAFYVWLAGPSPSLLRATLQGGAVLIGLWVGRGRIDALGALGLAGLVSLAWSPLWVFDVGFRLSFLAAGSLLLVPRVEGRLPSRWPTWLKVGLAGTLLAEISTAPIVAHTFHALPLPLASVPANLLAAPLMALLVPLGFMAGLAGPLAAPINLLVGPLVKLLLALVTLFGHWPSVPWGEISAAGWAAYGLFGVCVTLWLRRRLGERSASAVCLACVLVTMVAAKSGGQAREIVFLDVGQGDATLIRLGDFTMLIDGGGTPRGSFDVGARTVVPALKTLGVFDLDVVVLTHPDADHVEGLTSVLSEVPVGEVWLGRRTNAPIETAVLHAAKTRRVPVRAVARGDHITVGNAALDVMWPARPFSKEDNENSVAIRLDVGTFRAAFLGDLPSGVESRLNLGRLDLLKVAHHGSRFSTSEALLSETRPRDAVISVGRNTYGHPNSDVLNRLRAAGIRVWRTDEAGAIRWPLP